MRLPGWVAYALASFLCYGVTNSLLGAIYEWSDRNPDTPVTAPFILWLTMGAVGVAAAAVFKLKKRGYKGLPSRRFVWIAGAAGVTLSAAMLTLKLGLASDPDAKGPIVAISSTNAMIVALAAFFILREKLSRWQLAGMLVIIGGIIAMALGNGAGSSARGLLFGLATMVLFGVTNFLLKYAGHHGSDSVTTTAILWLAAGICGVLGVGYCLIRYGHLPGMQEAPLILWAVLAGVTLALGMLFLKRAVTKGPGGPATAITGSNSVLVALFEFLVFAHVPPVQKLIGMGIALVGIAVLSLGGGRATARR
ncbi:MAG: DMT family transporter [Thermoleophilia bacterium]|nr:DMT family transporter [Thermoleophilia bacterium]